MSTDTPPDEPQRPASIKGMDEENVGEASPTPTDVSPDEWRASTQVKMIVACLAIVQLVVSIDASILVPAFPTIAKAVDASASETFWVGTSYLLTNSTFQPLLGALSDVFRRREILLASVVLFTIGTLIACLAQNIETLLAGRTVQGIGGGGIITLHLVILTDIIPLRKRAKFYSVAQIAWAAGTIMGPLVGGVIAQEATWRLLFYINFPFCAVGLVMVPWVVRLNMTRRLSFQDTLRRIDWVGSLVFIAGTTSFLIGITWGGHLYPWNSYQTLVPMLLGFAGICGAGVWEWRYAELPFLRRKMLRSRHLMTAYFCTLLQGLLLYGHIYFIALYLLSVKGMTPILTGVALLPICFGLMPTSAFVGVAVSRMGTWRWAVWLGWVANTLAAGLVILLDEGTSTVARVFIFLAVGMGQGILLSAHNLQVQAIADVEDVAYATTVYAFIRGVGVCLGVAVGGAVFQNRLQARLGSFGLPADIATNAEAYVFELVAMPDDSPVRIETVTAFAQSFRFLFEVLAAISGAGLLLSLTVTQRYSLDKALLSGHVLKEKCGSGSR